MSNGNQSVLDKPVDPALIAQLWLLWDVARPYLLLLVADTGIADALGEAPETAETLARKTGLNTDALHRVLFMLSGYGVFSYADGRFAHTPLSLLMRSHHPQSQLGVARLTSASESNKPWLTALGEVLRAGRPAHARNGGDVFTLLAANPDLARIFDEAMSAKSRIDIAGILKAYDFRAFGSIADIGGGRGHLIRAVLGAAPEAQGVLFDLPHSVEPQRAISTPRLRLQAGDFFKDSLPACDAYLLMNVIHDWSDEKAVEILKSVRKAAPYRAKLLLLETLMPDRPSPSLAVLLDMTMLASTGGRERNQAQYEALLKAGGFKLDRVIPTESGMSILEATPAR